VVSGKGCIGFNSGSIGEATVTGAGSQWSNSGNLLVGYEGDGVLNVEAGGMVSLSRDGSILGASPGSTGLATIIGANSTWSNRKGLYIGGNNSGTGGTGILNIVDSGLVTVGKTTKLWSDGTINLDGGTLDVGVLHMAIQGKHIQAQVTRIPRLQTGGHNRRQDQGRGVGKAENGVAGVS